MSDIAHLVNNTFVTTKELSEEMKIDISQILYSKFCDLFLYIKSFVPFTRRFSLI